MLRLTAKKKEELAYKILELLKDYDMNEDVRIYFSKKCLTGNGEIIEGVLASYQFDYANDDTLSMSFEGPLHSVLNYYAPATYSVFEPLFTALLEEYGLYYELGNAWNLATYYNEPELNKSPKPAIPGSTPKKRIQIYSGNCPVSVCLARDTWEQQQNEYGDIGSCVLGAGFTFKLNDLYYKMPPQGRWQGSISWEASIQNIWIMLIEAGCEEVGFDYGHMD